MIDENDREILSILLGDAAVSKAEIARRVGLAASVVSDRVRRLEAENIIQGYEVRIDPRTLGRPLLAFVFVTDVKPSQGFDTACALSGITGLEELHKIRAADTDELNAIIETQISPVQSVTRVRTTIVLNAVAERPCLAGHDIRTPQGN